MGWEQTEQGYLGGGGQGLGWMSPERKRRDGMKGLEKGGLPHGALGVVADISPLRQYPGKNTNCQMSVCWTSLAPDIVGGGGGGRITA